MLVSERHAILTIRDASKLDSGPYRISAENELGSDSAIINIEISGKQLFTELTKIAFVLCIIKF